jgi:site-specific recombinase XerD
MKIEPETNGGALTTVSTRVANYLEQGLAPATRRAYASDLRHFDRWCTATGRRALPADPETVAEYLAELAEQSKASTLQRRLSAISQAHQFAGLESPTWHPAVRATLKGIRRSLASSAPERARAQGKEALTVAQLLAMVALLPDDPRGHRDRALLLLGFASGLRRSELVALDVADLAWQPEGLVLRIDRSKTDQEGAGRRVGVPVGSGAATCPVAATRAWLATSGVAEGPVFRSIDRYGNLGGRLSDRSVALTVKRAAQAAGFDPETVAGHSLRAGLATAAARAGKSERMIAAQTGHASMAVLRGYIRDGSLFRDNAADGIGL